jgi:hypothetical protein
MTPIEATVSSLLATALQNRGVGGSWIDWHQSIPTRTGQALAAVRCGDALADNAIAHLGQQIMYRLIQCLIVTIWMLNK